MKIKLYDMGLIVIRLLYCWNKPENIIYLLLFINKSYHTQWHRVHLTMDGNRIDNITYKQTLEKSEGEIKH